MILTAVFVASVSYEACHNDDYDASPETGVIVLVLLGVFMWFDLRMAEVIA